MKQQKGTNFDIPIGVTVDIMIMTRFRKICKSIEKSLFTHYQKGVLAENLREPVMK